MSTGSISSAAPLYQPNTQSSATQNPPSAAPQGVKGHHGHRHHGEAQKSADSSDAPATTDAPATASAAGALDITA